MSFIKYIFRYSIRAVLYAAAFAAIGIIFSFIRGWPVLKGAYIFVLGGGIVTMIVAIALLIGTPSMRKAMFASPERRREPQAGAEGIGAALMGIFIVIIGFWLESLMH
ncbi:hypothetical protein [Geosporobacter ferrireducens]|uniref:Uncharacterized protein n=1 Tax=Geosporobacter ferrireducens TaxID=1424294 RepID=A0A1D8GJF9_9FIRM|nr:hypothetical protein [Geosporobacter ferrireducens]AOT71047.1 hypothetical protein Gferi_16670 [Geosporobacter ferrireducens]MTI58270.1 hypothetical protein [Geosporobacter ferrireducens]